MTIGIKNFEPIDFFAGASKFQRCTGDLTHRQGGTTSCIAIGFGQHDAAQRQRLFEGTRRVHGVLALHGVDHEQRLDGVQGLVQASDFLHQRFINGQTTGGIDNQHIQGRPIDIAEHLGEPISLTQVATAANTSAFYFCKIFKHAVGLTFTDYLARTRVEKTKQLLLNPNVRVSEAAYAAGFQSLSQFNRVFRRVTGESPTRYRERLHGATPRPNSLAFAA